MPPVESSARTLRAFCLLRITPPIVLPITSNATANATAPTSATTGA